jgi:hypothetical protein
MELLGIIPSQFYKKHSGKVNKADFAIPNLSQVKFG